MKPIICVSLRHLRSCIMVMDPQSIPLGSLPPPSPQEVSAVHTSSSPGGRALLPAILLALLELVGNSFLVFTVHVLSG